MDALQDDLFGGLRGDAAEVGRLALIANRTANLGVAIQLQRVRQRDLRARIQDSLHHFLLADNCHVAGDRIDGGSDRRRVIRIIAPVRVRQGLLDGSHDDIARQILLRADLIDSHDEIVLHPSDNSSSCVRVLHIHAFAKSPLQQEKWGSPHFSITTLQDVATLP